MIFDKTKIYTAVNADELKIGSKVIVANTLFDLRQAVENNSTVEELVEVQDDTWISRFTTREITTSGDEEDFVSPLAYLVEEPQEQDLKWTDLKIGNIIRKQEGGGWTFLVINGIDTNPSTDRHIFVAYEGWLKDKDLQEYELVTEVAV